MGASSPGLLQSESGLSAGLSDGCTTEVAGNPSALSMDRQAALQEPRRALSYGGRLMALPS